MIGAIVKENIVQNLIIVNPAQVELLSKALKCDIVDASPYGLAIGDLRTQAGWTRNAGGEQIILPLLNQKSYDSYTITAEENIHLKAQQKIVAENAANEALAILAGEDKVV
jgi:hypothetical protein